MYQARITRRTVRQEGYILKCWPTIYYGWRGPEWLEQPETQWPVSAFESMLEAGEERNANPGRIVLLTFTSDSNNCVDF